MGFDAELVGQVWAKARAAHDQDAEVWRQDECGAWMKREHYGNADSDFGWKIENIVGGGPDTPQNLRAFHHANGYDRANRHPKCYVTADRIGIEPREHIGQPRNRALKAR